MVPESPWPAAVGAIERAGLMNMSACVHQPLLVHAIEGDALSLRTGDTP